MNRLLQVVAIGCMALSIGCSPQSAQQEQRRGDKTRETVAKATQRMKPELEWSARKAGAIAEWAADETLAAIEGFFEGWFSSPSQPVNLNSASQRQLETLPGLSPEDAHRIIRSRPYSDKRELVKKGVISEAAYLRIGNRITAN
jgi:DNA uptake protein ComE-like DNA-binding protein